MPENQQPSVPASVKNLMCAFEAAIQAYEFHCQDEHGFDNSGVGDNGELRQVWLYSSPTAVNSAPKEVSDA